MRSIYISLPITAKIRNERWVFHIFLSLIFSSSRRMLPLDVWPSFPVTTWTLPFSTDSGRSGKTSDNQSYSVTTQPSQIATFSVHFPFLCVCVLLCFVVVVVFVVVVFCCCCCFVCVCVFLFCFCRSLFNEAAYLAAHRRLRSPPICNPGVTSTSRKWTYRQRLTKIYDWTHLLLQICFGCNW